MSNQNEEDEMSNPSEGDDVSKYFQDEELPNEDPQNEELTEEEKEVALKVYNKASKKNYKSFDQLVEREKNMDKMFAQKKVIKEEAPKEVINLGLEERLLKVEQPLTQYVIEEMKQVAKTTGKSLEELWSDDSGYFQGKALAINAKKDATKRVSVPSNNIDVIEKDSAEKAMSKKFMKDFPAGIKVPGIN
jgi:hypothetical protein